MALPTKTFFNLPQEKRQKLLDAMHAEFSRVSFDEVSINQIVKTAGIPRGSFYQYFENKRDMLRYLLANYRQTMMRRARESLEKGDGDLFAMFLDILDFTHAFVTEEKNNYFCKSVFSDLRINSDLFHWVGGRDLGEFGRALLPYVNMALLDIRGEDDFGDMLGVLLAVTGEAFAKAFFDRANYEDARLEYAIRLALLRRGFYKNKAD
ncbi:hypothetical protein FACS1894196_1680 [Clostridia bacterium]|nr:hypothetical protein FACS1894196_1680 [Clostridia bacterium]